MFDLFDWLIDFFKYCRRRMFHFGHERNVWVNNLKKCWLVEPVDLYINFYWLRQLHLDFKYYETARICGFVICENVLLHHRIPYITDIITKPLFILQQAPLEVLCSVYCVTYLEKGQFFFKMHTTNWTKNIVMVITFAKEMRIRSSTVRKNLIIWKIIVGYE